MTRTRIVIHMRSICVTRDDDARTAARRPRWADADQRTRRPDAPRARRATRPRTGARATSGRRAMRARGANARDGTSVVVVRDDGRDHGRGAKGRGASGLVRRERAVAGNERRA